MTNLLAAIFDFALERAPRLQGVRALVAASLALGVSIAAPDLLVTLAEWRGEIAGRAVVDAIIDVQPGVELDASSAARQ